MPTILPVSFTTVLERLNAMRISAEQSLSQVQTYLTSNPQPLARVVAGYRALLADTGRRLLQAQAKVVQARANNPTDPTLLALERRIVELLTMWSAHAKGYAAYERPATEAEKTGAVQIGVAPVAIIAIAIGAAVIAVSLTGIAWAVVHYKEAQTLSEEIALVERDPSLADAIAKINASAPSSAPPDLPSPDSGGGFGWLLAAAGIAAAAIFIVPKLGKG